jgi:hypothetical protein
LPDLQLDDSHYELKGIRVGSSRTLIAVVGGGVRRSTGFSTGVAKKELSTANRVVEKAAKLYRDTFGVAFGQFGEMGPGLEALLASAWRNEGRMRWRIGLSSKPARRQSGADVPHAAALGGCGVAGANAGPPW